MAEIRRAPPVPTTSIYSRTDGVVAWRCSINDPGPRVENIRVHASHLGLCMNPTVLYAIADRLEELTRLLGDPSSTDRRVFTALAVLARGTRALASAFLSAAALLDLTHVVVGGGVAAAGPVLFDPLLAAYAELAVYPHLAAVRIVPAALPRGSGLVGAGRLGWQVLAGAAPSER